MRTISPNKLQKRLSALTKKHATMELELETLQIDAATRINSAEAIATLKRRKCAVKNAISTTTAQLAATGITPAPVEAAKPAALDAATLWKLQQEAFAESKNPEREFFDYGQYQQNLATKVAAAQAAA